MRSEVLSLQRRIGVATLYVTHDQTEAMTMGDKVAVLHEGRLLQCATPRELYLGPATMTVAKMIGSPGMNLIPAVVASDRCRLVVGQQIVEVHDGAYESLLAQHAGGPVVLGVRPEDVQIEDLQPPASVDRMPMTLLLFDMRKQL